MGQDTHVFLTSIPRHNETSKPTRLIPGRVIRRSPLINPGFRKEPILGFRTLSTLPEATCLVPPLVTVALGQYHKAPFIISHEPSNRY